MSEQQLTGGCLCGHVRYRSAVSSADTTLCHCRSCRLASGAPAVAWATFPLAAFTWTANPPATYCSSPGVLRGFCPCCGCTLSYAEVARPGSIDIAIATLDDPATTPPVDHTWLEHRVAWDVPGDDLPRFLTTREAGLAAR